jgi:hypothetical protein
MSFIRRLISATTPPTKLGRWHLHYDPKIVNSKVDQANEDHCGCCHENNQTMKQDQMLRQTQKQMQKYSESEEYYIPYVMFGEP